MSDKTTISLARALVVAGAGFDTIKAKCHIGSVTLTQIRKDLGVHGKRTSMKGSPWNEENVAQLRALWAEGVSTAEIGRRLGFGKNSIVGKAHRMGLAARPDPIDRSGVRKAKPRIRRVKPKQTTLPALEHAVVAPKPSAPAGAFKNAALIVASGDGKSNAVRRLYTGQLFNRYVPVQAAVGWDRFPEEAEPTRKFPTRHEPLPRSKRIIECQFITSSVGRKHTFCDKPSRPGASFCEDCIINRGLFVGSTARDKGDAIVGGTW